MNLDKTKEVKDLLLERIDKLEAEIIELSSFLNDTSINISSILEKDKKSKQEWTESLSTSTSDWIINTKLLLLSKKWIQKELSEEYISNSNFIKFIKSKKYKFFFIKQETNLDKLLEEYLLDEISLKMSNPSTTVELLNKYRLLTSN